MKTYHIYSKKIIDYVKEKNLYKDGMFNSYLICMYRFIFTFDEEKPKCCNPSWYLLQKPECFFSMHSKGDHLIVTTSKDEDGIITHTVKQLDVDYSLSLEKLNDEELLFRLKFAELLLSEINKKRVAVNEAMNLLKKV